MNIKLLTGYNEAFVEIGDICANSLRRYGSNHGLPVSVESIPIDFPRPASWAKCDLILKHLSASDFVLWIDADAMIVGGLDIRGLLVNSVLNIAKDANGINCGVMAWKNCMEAQRALMRMRDDPEDHHWFEQNALMKFVDELEVHYQEKEVWNAYPEDRTERSLILHWPGRSIEERLPLMREEAFK